MTNPWVSSFTNFIFGKGLVFTIGIIASIVPIIYQLASEETNERLITRLQNYTLFYMPAGILFLFTLSIGHSSSDGLSAFTQQPSISSDNESHGVLGAMSF